MPPDPNPIDPALASTRRQFLTAAAGLTGYTLLVKAPQSLSGASDKFVARGEISPRIDELAPSAAKLGAVADEPNMRRVDLDCDVFIAGGGLAGVSAAISAARLGSRVILAQDRSRLGGNASSEIKMHPLGSMFGFREGGLIEEFCLENAWHNGHYAWELWDLMLYDKVIREPNIRLILDSSLYRVEKEGDAISSAWVRCDKSEHLYHITSRLFMDCTGDGRLGLEAGAEFRIGRESSEVFGEPLADYDEPGTTQGSSILFTARELDHPVAYEPPSWARSITEDDLYGRPTTPDTWNYGYWWIELGGIYDTIRDNERLRFELLAVVLGVWDFIKNSGKYPEADNWALDTVGMIPGKRESRRFIGDTMMVQQDIEGGWKKFDDAVAFGGWKMDDHPALGFDAKDRKPFLPSPYPEPYNIPFSSLYSRNVPNLLMAGRNISASHVAFTSARVMKTCSVIGQAAGTAAHYCHLHDISPRQLRETPARIQEVQQRLLRDGALIMKAKNEDSADIARTATASASDCIAGTTPAQVLSGRTYDQKGKTEHRWIAPAEGSPWFRLAWDQPVSLSEVQLIHDTGLDRQLTMTVSKRTKSRSITGPQPETARDYVLIGERPDGSEVELAKTTFNYQRLRRHTFAPVELRSVRIKITAGHGDTVGLYEVRAYA